MRRMKGKKTLTTIHNFWAELHHINSMLVIKYDTNQNSNKKSHKKPIEQSKAAALWRVKENNYLSALSNPNLAPK